MTGRQQGAEKTLTHVDTPGNATDEATGGQNAAVRPRIICLCGSTRFIEQFATATWELELQGHIVLGCTLLPMWFCGVRSHFAEKTGTKDQRDWHHLRKVDLADEVLVLDIGGYIGESTRNEIDYATRTGKPIRYVSQMPELLERILPLGSDASAGPQQGAEKTMAHLDSSNDSSACATGGTNEATPALLPYERIDDDALLKAVYLMPGERLLVLQPYGWHIDAHHIPNAAEHFSRGGVCEDHGWEVVSEFGPYIAIVRALSAGLPAAGEPGSAAAVPTSSDKDSSND